MQDVAIFWDYAFTSENCSPPSNASGYIIANNIRLMAQAYGSVKSLRAYLEITEQASSARTLALRSEFQASGISLIDCPHNGRKEVADKMIIGKQLSIEARIHTGRNLVDMLAYAIDNPAPSVIVLISGDRDFAYALSTLRLRKHQVILVTLSNAHPSLKLQASACIDWQSTIINPDIRPPLKMTSNPVESVIRTVPCRDSLARSSPSQSSLSQPSYYAQETESIGQVDYRDPLHYLRISTSARPRCPSEAPSFNIGPQARYESPRQDASPAIEVEPTYTHPSLVSGPTSTNSSVSNSSPPAIRTISNSVQNRDSTFAPGMKDTVVGPTDAQVSFFWSSANEQGFSTSLQKSDNSTLPTLLPSIMQETLQHSLVTQYTVLETDDEGSTSGLRSIYPIRHASTPHSLPLQSPFPDAEALRIPLDSSATNQQHILTLQEAPGKPFSSVVGSTNLSEVPMVTSEDIRNSPDLDPPDIDFTYRRSPQKTSSVANSNDQPPITSSQASPSITSSQKTIDRLPPITPVMSSISQARSFTTDRSKTIDKLPPITPIMSPTNQASPSIIIGSQETIDRLPPITPITPSINQVGKPLLSIQNITNKPSILSSTATDSSKPEGQVAPPIFKLLVDILKIEKAKGCSRPLRSFVADVMYKKGFTYNNTGASNFSQYTALAVQWGVIELGFQKTEAWISLKPEYQDTPHTLHAPPAPIVAPIFKILVEKLKVYKSNGILRPLRSHVAIAISRDGLTYKEAGVEKFSQYASLAEKEGIIALGGREAKAWISLKPEYENTFTI